MQVFRHSYFVFFLQNYFILCKIVKEYPQVQLLTLRLDQIQPSQFFVDEDKIAAISSFIHKPQDIIIQVLPNEDRFISLDGHTRLYYAVMKGWECVRAVVEPSDDWAYKFVSEAQKRGIYAPNDMTLVSHAEYEEKWNRFCDDFFADDVVKQNGNQTLHKRPNL